tara:strand:- start:374 stop:721 length:348 start_codon:yes stop_codon:yes gene_type:complete
MNDEQSRTVGTKLLNTLVKETNSTVALFLDSDTKHDKVKYASAVVRLQHIFCELANQLELGVTIEDDKFDFWGSNLDLEHEGFYKAVDYFEALEKSETEKRQKREQKKWERENLS